MKTLSLLFLHLYYIQDWHNEQEAKNKKQNQIFHPEPFDLDFLNLQMPGDYSLKKSLGNSEYTDEVRQSFLAESVRGSAQPYASS